MKEVKRYDSYGYDGLSGLMKEHADGDAANALSTACVPKEIASAITWSEHLLFECGALVQTRAPSVHVYNKTFEAVQAAKAMLAAAPAQPQSDGVMVPRELLERVVKPVLFTSQEDSHYDACTELRALLGGDQPAQPCSAKGGE